MDEHGFDARTPEDEQGPEVDTPETETGSAADTPLPGFPSRFVGVFLNPGRTMEALAAHPAWVAALLVGALLVMLQALLLPAEVFETAMREALAQRGQEIPAGTESAVAMMRIAGVVGGLVGYAIITALLAGLFTLVFSFVLGDEGRYTQYLAAYAHAQLIPAVIGLLLVPLRIMQGSPQLTLNLGTFFFFLDDGYLLKVLTMMDLAQLWALLVMAAGAHAINPKRSFGSAAVVTVSVWVLMAMAFAPFAPTP
ncbi:MAG: YIP1 family protein [Gemmatimonadota bacterium]